jgi:hypothetical protein
MKSQKLIVIAAIVCLLLGASTTQAATVICQNEPEPCAEGDSVIRIEDLEVTDSMDVTTVYRVDFVNTPAIDDDVYGYNLVYDFTNQEDVSLAMGAVLEALNTNVPIPLSAGTPPSSNQFFIGAKTVGDQSSDDVFVLAVGSESSEEGWDECTTDCLKSVAALDSVLPFTYAVFDDGKPGLLSPSGEIDDNNPDYTWRSVENSTYYFLLVEDIDEEIIVFRWYSAWEAGCFDPTGQFSLRGQECYVPSPEDLEDGSYNWSVLNWIEPDNDKNKWSDPLSFTVTVLPPQTLEVKKEGEGAGTVISDPPGIDCGDTCSADFSEWVILKAIPDDGFELTSWDGCYDVDPITNECTVVMTEAKTVTATFSARPPQSLTVKKEDEGAGTVTSDPPGIDCGDTCFALFDSTKVALTATPDAGSELKSWIGCDEVSLITKTCIVVMTEAKTVTAIF